MFLHINARHMRVSAEVGGSLPFVIYRELLPLLRY